MVYFSPSSFLSVSLFAVSLATRQVPHVARMLAVVAPRLCLSGRELPTDVVGIAFTFLSLRELARLLPLCRALRGAALRALERLCRATVRSRQEAEFAARHCRRLVDLDVCCCCCRREGGGRDAGQLLSRIIAPSAVTLRSITACTHHVVVTPFIEACRGLTALSGPGIKITGEDTRRLVEAHPALADLAVCRLELGCLLASALPLQRLDVYDSTLLPEHVPFLDRHTSLERLYLQLGSSLTSPDLNAFFRRLQRLPRLRELLLRRHLDSDRTQPHPPSAAAAAAAAEAEAIPAIVLPALREFHYWGNDPGDGSVEAVPLPEFSAPRMNAIGFRRAGPELAGLARRFPALTSYRDCDGPSLRTAEDRVALAEALTTGALKGLSRLRVMVGTRLDHFLTLVPNLPRSLRTLSLDLENLVPEALRFLLSRLPRLEALSLADRWGVGSERRRGAAASSWEGREEPPFTHAHLRELGITGCLAAYLRPTFSAASLPALVELRLCELIGDWPLGLHPDRHPRLQTLKLDTCELLTLSVVGGTVHPLPALRSVDIAYCPWITSQQLNGLAPNAVHRSYRSDLV